MEDINKSLAVVKMLKQLMDSFKQTMKHEFKDMNMTGTQGMLTGILSRHGKMKISELSEKMALSNSTISGIIDRLEKQNLVERTRSLDDRRVVYVNITPEFEKIIKSHFCEIEKKFEAKIKTASQEELDTVLKGLETLKELIDRQ